MPSPRSSSLLTLGVAAALVAAAPAMASPSFLFSQAAPTAVSVATGARTATLTLATGHRPVLAFAERPTRWTGTLRERLFIGLWRGTFRTDHPNAILTGVDAAGHNRRSVVVLTGASRTARGVRYRVRTLAGTLPKALTGVNLMIDSVDGSAITAALQAYLAGNASRVTQWESIINALHFPTTATVNTGNTIVVTPGNPLTLGTGASGPTMVAASVLTLEPDAQVAIGSPQVLNPVTLTASTATLGGGSSIVVQGPNAISATLTFQPTALGCQLPPQVGVSARALASGGDSTSAGFTTTLTGMTGDVCSITWTVPRGSFTTTQQFTIGVAPSQTWVVSNMRLLVN